MRYAALLRYRAARTIRLYVYVHAVRILDIAHYGCPYHTWRLAFMRCGSALVVYLWPRGWLSVAATCIVFRCAHATATLCRRSPALLVLRSAGHRGSIMSRLAGDAHAGWVHLAGRLCVFTTWLGGFYYYCTAPAAWTTLQHAAFLPSFRIQRCLGDGLRRQDAGLCLPLFRRFINIVVRVLSSPYSFLPSSRVAIGVTFKRLPVLLLPLFFCHNILLRISCYRCCLRLPSSAGEIYVSEFT